MVKINIPDIPKNKAMYGLILIAKLNTSSLESDINNSMKNKTKNKWFKLFKKRKKNVTETIINERLSEKKAERIQILKKNIILK